MYNMKRVTASEARRNWFRLLDEVVAGEVVTVERDGVQIVVRREEGRAGSRSKPFPDYRGLLKAPDADRADEWGWEWGSDDEGLTSRDAS